MIRFRIFRLLPCLAALGGCMAYSNMESVTVQTTAPGGMVVGAQCTLSNKNGTWVMTTPGSVEIHLGSEFLVVKCVKPGFAEADLQVHSKTNYSAILLDGAIQSTVSGAAWSYPQVIQVPMQAAPPPPAAAPN